MNDVNRSRPRGKYCALSGRKLDEKVLGRVAIERFVNTFSLQHCMTDKEWLDALGHLPFTKIHTKSSFILV